MPLILVIEDQKDISDLIRINLQMIGFTVTVCPNAHDALKCLNTEKYDLITLDLNLPDMDGFELCLKARELGVSTPILMISARTSDINKVEGFEVGADDYLTKPFSVLELQARAKALLRRSRIIDNAPEDENKKGVIEIGNIRIVPDKHKVIKGKSEIQLTSKEFDLLFFMASNPGKVYSRDQLLASVWGYHYDGYEHTVNSHINRLRSKLEDDPSTPQFVRTVWGVGYCFRDVEDEI